jgi:hypothetical protein
MIKHLLDLGFRMESSNTISNKTILNNNSSVGSNCLSFIQDNVRYKIYNKFWHSLEVKSNKAQVGTNIYNWINNKEERLREIFRKLWKMVLLD